MKNKLPLLLTALALCFNVALFGVEKPKEFKIPYEKYILANGMNVILHVDKSDPIAAVYVVYHVGSAREIQGKTGFAHLFEHLRFNESQDIPQGQWFKKLQTAGASNVNGSTNTDRTNYFEVVPKNAVEMALWMESDRMGFLTSKVNDAIAPRAHPFVQPFARTQSSATCSFNRLQQTHAIAQRRIHNARLKLPGRECYVGELFNNRGGQTIDDDCIQIDNQRERFANWLKRKHGVGIINRKQL